MEGKLDVCGLCVLQEDYIDCEDQAQKNPGTKVTQPASEWVWNPREHLLCPNGASISFSMRNFDTKKETCLNHLQCVEAQDLPHQSHASQLMPSARGKQPRWHIAAHLTVLLGMPSALSVCSLRAKRVDTTGNGARGH
eukprot:1161779-Pelagomonas_calceolata.AAC.4